MCGSGGRPVASTRGDGSNNTTTIPANRFRGIFWKAPVEGSLGEYERMQAMTADIEVERAPGHIPDAQRDCGERDPERQSTRITRWAWIIYVVVALAAPLLLYAGPDVLSPAAPAVADAAVEGHLTLQRHAAHAGDPADHAH